MANNASPAAAQPKFIADKEYSFSLRSFRVRNNFMFATVKHGDENLEVLIGNSTDYRIADMLSVKQMGGNVYGTFKEMHNHNGVDYPRFWNVSIG
jgi:hypothetical protein